MILIRYVFVGIKGASYILNYLLSKFSCYVVTQEEFRNLSKKLIEELRNLSKKLIEELRNLSKKLIGVEIVNDVSANEIKYYFF